MYKPFEITIEYGGCTVAFHSRMQSGLPYTWGKVNVGTTERWTKLVDVSVTFGQTTRSSIGHTFLEAWKEMKIYRNHAIAQEQMRIEKEALDAKRTRKREKRLAAKDAHRAARAAGK